jgi:hypothetical protein
MNSSRDYLEIEYPISKYIYPTLSWRPVVKNWFNREAYENDDHSLLYPDLDENAWVAYKDTADIRLSLKTDLTHSARPLLVLDVTAGFEPAGYEKNIIPQFLDPYQDEMTLVIQPETERIQSLEQYQADLNSSANYNHDLEKKEISGHVQAGINVVGGIKPGPHIEGGSHYRFNHSQKKFRIEDFRLFSKATQHTTIYRAIQQQCYYENTPYRYDIQSPDDSMHFYGHCPDYFCEPSDLAKGGLTIHAIQTYALNPQLDTKTIPINIEISQRLVSMSIWRWCANHWFINRAKISYSCELSIRGKESVISKVGFFKYSCIPLGEIKTTGQINTHTGQPYNQNIGPIVKVEHRKNDSWKGYNYHLDYLPKSLPDHIYHPCALHC